MRALWLTSAALLVGLVLGTPTLAVVAIWNASDRLGGIAGVLGVCAVVGGFAFGCWTDDAKPKRGLPRAARKVLRAEQSRIALDAAIAKAEREAGIR